MARRTALVVVLVLSLVAAGCGGNDNDADPTPPSTFAAVTTTMTTAPTTTAVPTTTEEAAMASVLLPDYPRWETETLSAAPERLDSLAAGYLADAGDEASMERFLFGQMPVVVFDGIFAEGAEADAEELFWLLHLSGYFGGRWLRGEIADAQPEALLVGFSDPPTEASFVDTMTRVSARLVAVDDDTTVVEAARAALFDRPNSIEGEAPIPGVADSFGYNVGYMLEILATPPEGVDASPRFDVTCDGLFSCSYASPKLAVLPQLADTQAEINSAESSAPGLVAELVPVQNAAEPRGRGVWSGGLSVQGFSQESYDQLLDVSSSFLETVQATGLVNVRAVIDDDPERAKVGIIAEAAQIVWLDAYIAGLTNGEGTIELPTFG